MSKKSLLITFGIALLYLGYSIYSSLNQPEVNLGKENRGLEKAVIELLDTEDSSRIDQGIRNFIIHITYIKDNDTLALKLAEYFKSDQLKQNWKKRIEDKILNKKEKGIETDLYNLPSDLHDE